MEGIFSPRRFSKKHAAKFGSVLALALAAAPIARAANAIWDGGGASALWNDGGNWTGATPNPLNDVFIGTGFASGTDIGINGVGAIYTVNSLTINTITGFRIERALFNSDLILTIDSGNLTRQNVTGTEADQFLDIDVYLGASGVWNIAGSNSLIVRGFIADFNATPVNLTKTGTGTLVLQATQQFAFAGAYDGTTSLNQGRIRVVGAGNFASGIGDGAVTVADGATLELQSLSNGPASPLRLTGFGVDLIFPIGSHDGALKNVSGNSQWDGPVTLLSDSSINVDAGTLTLSGGISDGANTFQLSKFGAGELLLPVANTHGGGVNISSGPLTISHGGALGSAGTTSVGINGSLGIKGGIFVPRAISLSGVNLGGAATLLNLEDNNTLTGTLTLVGGSAISAAAGTTLTLTGLVTDNGNARSLTKLGDGKLIINHANSFTGGLIVSEGTAQFAVNTAVASGVSTTVESGASLELPGGLTVTRIVQLNGGGFSSKGALYSVGNNTWNGGITLQSNASLGAEAGGTFTIAGAISGAFTLSKVGPGTLILSNVASNFSNLNVNEGTLVVSSPSGLPPAATVAVINGGKIELSGNSTINRPLRLTGDGIADSGALHNISGNNTWSGTVLLPGAASVRVDAGASLVLPGAISGSGALTKAGAGMLTVIGANTYTGITTLEEGVLRLENSSALGATPNLHVLAGAAVQVNDEITIPRPLIASGTGILNTGALRSVGGENIWSGPLTMEDHLTVGVDADGTLTLSAAVSDGAGVFALTKVGAGTLVLGGLNSYKAGTVINGGIVSISADINLGLATAAVTANNGGKLLVTGNTTTARTFNLNTGSLQVASGATLIYANATVNGGFLRGPGTHSIGGGSSLNGVTALPGNTILQSSATSLSNFTNSGAFISNAPLTWDGGYNTSAGAISVNNSFNTTAFENGGIININNGGLLSNSANNLVSGGGSRININSGGRLDVSGNALDLNGALLLNNGTIAGTTNINFGSLAKGSGVYGAVNVTDGGRFSPGNSPGSVTTGAVTWNSGGSYTVEIADALAGPGVGWDLWNIAGDLLINSSTSSDRQFSIVLTSLAGDAAGPAAHFDPSHDYHWLIARSANDLGENDLDRFTLDAHGFANPMGSGNFALSTSGNSLYVDFVAVPEPIFATALLPLALLLRRRIKQNRF